MLIDIAQVTSILLNGASARRWTTPFDFDLLPNAVYRRGIVSQFGWRQIRSFDQCFHEKVSFHRKFLSRNCLSIRQVKGDVIARIILLSMIDRISCLRCSMCQTFHRTSTLQKNEIYWRNMLLLDLSYKTSSKTIGNRQIYVFRRFTCFEGKLHLSRSRSANNEVNLFVNVSLVVVCRRDDWTSFRLIVRVKLADESLFCSEWTQSCCSSSSRIAEGFSLRRSSSSVQIKAERVLVRINRRVSLVLNQISIEEKTRGKKEKCPSIHFLGKDPVWQRRSVVEHCCLSTSRALWRWSPVEGISCWKCLWAVSIRVIVILLDFYLFSSTEVNSLCCSSERFPHEIRLVEVERKIIGPKNIFPSSWSISRKERRRIARWRSRSLQTVNDVFLCGRSRRSSFVVNVSRWNLLFRVRSTIVFHRWIVFTQISLRLTTTRKTTMKEINTSHKPSWRN